MNPIKPYILPILLFISALSLSLTAAFYSVTGLSKLFSGAALAIIIMASALEASKLIIATFLHHYWKTLNKLLKIYLTTALCILIIITSLGIYGFLTAAYQETLTQSQVIKKEIQLIENQKQKYYNNIHRDSTSLSIKNQRIISLTQLRIQQETRLDSLYSRKAYNSAKQTELIIKDANDDLKSLQSEIDTLNKNIYTNQDSIFRLDQKIFQINTTDQSRSELGPLEYISNLLGKPMDIIINWFMIVLIFVFDPLAISLVIAFNFTLNQIKPKNTPILHITTIPPSPPTPSPNPKPDPKIAELENLKNQIMTSGFSSRKRSKKLEEINKQINSLKDNNNTITY